MYADNECVKARAVARGAPSRAARGVLGAAPRRRARSRAAIARAQDAAMALAQLVKLADIKVRFMSAPQGLEAVFGMMHSGNKRCKRAAMYVVDGTIKVMQIAGTRPLTSQPPAAASPATTRRCRDTLPYPCAPPTDQTRHLCRRACEQRHRTTLRAMRVPRSRASRTCSS